MSKKLYFAGSLILLLATNPGFAQTSLYVGPGANFSISSGTPVAIDGMVLIPSATYTITGENSQLRNSTLSHPSSNPHISRVLHWQNNLPAFTGTLTFYYDDAELNGLSESGLTLNVHNGSSWSAFAPTSRDGSANFVSTSLTNVAINELTLASIGQPLPMKWINADAVYTNGRNQIRWITADETNCRNYIVEKSFNGTSWSNVENPVAAHNTAGPNVYDLTDPSVPANLTLYRVRQNDVNGQYSYSSVLTVRINNGTVVQVYPNPVTTNLTVSANGRSIKTVEIYNAAGALVYIANAGNLSQHTVNCNNLASGIYNVIIRFNDNSSTKESFIKKQ